MRLYVAGVVIAALCSCSAGAVTTAPSAAGGTSPTTTSLTITIPHATAADAARRAPAYISASTQSIKIDIKPHGSGTSIADYPIVANLTATSAGCTSSVTSTVCSVNLTLGPANYDATLTMFDGTSASGNQLSAAQTMPLDIVEGQANTVPLALGGIPVSVQILASGGRVTASDLVFTLPAATSGTLAAYGVDADGNTIIGTGAPTMSVSTDNAASVTVTQPTTTAPNTIGVATIAANAIAHVTVTATPVAGTGSSAVATTVTVQVPTRSIIYLGKTNIRAFDTTGTEITRPGTFAAGTQVVSIAYDSANGLIYAGNQSASSYIVAFDKTGKSQPLNAGASAPALTGSLEGIAFDPANNDIYYSTTTNQPAAIDASGNAIALSGAIGVAYNLVYDPLHNLIIAGASSYNPDGTFHASEPYSPQVLGVAYNPINSLYYVASVYPTNMYVYDINGTAQSNCASFPLAGATEQLFAIAIDPQTGNFFLGTNLGHIYGFDQNCNALPAPWHTLNGVYVNAIAVSPP
jgi:hypothetical protein